MFNKPGVVPLYRTLKLLLGLDQKVRGQVQRLSGPLPQTSRHRPRDTT
jgi:hypothetical protein